MTEWGVFLVIVAVVGFVITISGPIAKATKAITALTVELKFFREEIAQIKRDNKEFQNSASVKHERIHTRIDEHDEKINDHEKRIIKLEHK